MAKTIYVGNLNYQTTEEDLNELFSQYGEVESVKLIMDRETNRPRGFAFVDMLDDDAATAAVSMLNDKDFNGRNLRVNEAKERSPRRDF
ncbi:MAG: RNA-binding protein [Spirochaetales bacterium]|nr:RNA-binding protein [Spirochaetales bacterium]